MEYAEETILSNKDYIPISLLKECAKYFLDFYRKSAGDNLGRYDNIMA